MNNKPLVFIIAILVLGNIFLAIIYFEEKKIADNSIKLIDYPVTLSDDLEYAYYSAGLRILTINRARHQQCNEITGQLSNVVKILRDSLIEKQQVKLWIDKEISPVDYYNAQINIPEKYKKDLKILLSDFKKSFGHLLTYDYLLAAHDTSSQTLYDTIPIDLAATKIEFTKFVKSVPDDGKFYLRETVYNLNDLTSIELNLVLEHLNFSIYSVWDEYTKACKKDHDRILADFIKRNGLL